MLLAPLFAPLLSFLLRDVVVKFVVFSAIFGLVGFLIPKAIQYLGPWLGTASLTNAFAGLPAGVWFFLDFFQLGFGVPLLISAYVARFLIRRLPVIG